VYSASVTLPETFNSKKTAAGSSLTSIIAIVNPKMHAEKLMVEPVQRETCRRMSFVTLDLTITSGKRHKT